MLAFSYGSFAHAFTFPSPMLWPKCGERNARASWSTSGPQSISSRLFDRDRDNPLNCRGLHHNDACSSLFMRHPSTRLFLRHFSYSSGCMSRIEKRRGSYLWLRNNLSTLGSQLSIPSSSTRSFVIPNDVLPMVIIGSYLLKLLVALIDTPIVYLVVYWLVGSWTARTSMRPSHHGSADRRDLHRATH